MFGVVLVLIVYLSKTCNSYKTIKIELNNIVFKCQLKEMTSILTQ